MEDISVSPARHSKFSRNIPLFIAFRVLFNARWYYPVMAVLFLDMGLSVEEYALLNVAWAAAIVGLEVPSGALADQIGRKRMVVLAAIFMVVEMALFAFAPRDNHTLLFWLLILNRVLSGGAEACASGADEALAYDSLAEDGRAKQWPAVLERVMRWQSMGFFAAMLIGAAVYDAAFMQKVIGFVGLPWKVTPEMTLRFPLYLTLMNSVLALLVVLNFREPNESIAGDKAVSEGTLHATWGATVKVGKWVFSTPLVLTVIATGLCFDSVVRVFLTFGSSYYRVIDLPAASYGLIGSGMALFGFAVPAAAKRMVAGWSMRTNFLVVAALVLAGLIGAAQVWKVYGLIWLIPIGVSMSLIQFFVSHYLNVAVTDSKRRATVLSFRGLAFNLAYGGAGLLFAGLTRYLHAVHQSGESASTDAIFAESLRWLLWYFAATLVLLVVAWQVWNPRKR